MEELIHEAPAPIPQLEERVSAWQLSPLLDRNPKLHCSSTLHLQPLSSSGACQMPVCAEITCRQGQGILEEDISNSLHFPAYQSQAAHPSSPLRLRQAGLMTAKSSKGPIIWMLLEKAKALILKK